MPLLVVCGSSGGATAAEKAPFGGSTAPLLPMRDSNSDRLGSSEDAAAGLEPRCTVALDEPDCSVGAGWALLVNDDRCLVRHDCLPAIAALRPGAGETGGEEEEEEQEPKSSGLAPVSAPVLASGTMAVRGHAHARSYSSSVTSQTRL